MGPFLMEQAKREAVDMMWNVFIYESMNIRVHMYYRICSSCLQIHVYIQLIYI